MFVLLVSAPKCPAAYLIQLEALLKPVMTWENNTSSDPCRCQVIDPCCVALHVCSSRLSTLSRLSNTHDLTQLNSTNHSFKRCRTYALLIQTLTQSPPCRLQVTLSCPLAMRASISRHSTPSRHSTLNKHSRHSTLNRHSMPSMHSTCIKQMPLQGRH